MSQSSCTAVQNTKMPLTRVLGVLVLMACCGFFMPYAGMLLGAALLLLATVSFTVLLRRSAFYAPILGALLFSLATLLASGSGAVLILSFGVPVAGALLAYSVSRRENRLSAAFAIAGTYILLLLFSGTYLLALSAEKAGAGDLLAHFVTVMDGAVDTMTASVCAALESSVETYLQMGIKPEEIVVPTEGEVHTLMVQLLSLAPGLVCLLTLVLAVALTYLLQLAALLLPGTAGGAPLFYPENRTYRVSAPFAILFLAVWIVSGAWVNYTSPVSLVLLNVNTVLLAVMAFGGVLGLPGFFRWIRDAAGGRINYILWIPLLIIMCLMYIQYAVTVFAVVYAVYILYNAFRSRKKEEE